MTPLTVKEVGVEEGVWTPNVSDVPALEEAKEKNNNTTGKKTSPTFWFKKTIYSYLNSLLEILMTVYIRQDQIINPGPL